MPALEEKIDRYYRTPETGKKVAGIIDRMGGGNSGVFDIHRIKSRQFFFKEIHNPLLDILYW
jgi:hypothetical protein